MCGINGYCGFNDKQKATAVIRQMNTALQHRGPDALQHTVTNDVALGHARLSIIDLSSFANQPMPDASGRYTIIFNGEIYNYQELKKELGHQALVTQSDTEILLYLFIKQGPDCLDKLRGMFALAIWDNEKKELFLARDRFGKKPLYYYQDGNTFLFSSEIRSLLSSGLVPKKMNQNVIREFIRYQTVHTPNTIIENVFMLKPGHFARVTTGSFIQTTYWKIPENDIEKSVSRKEATTEIRSLFENSIRDRMVADVEVGAFLSGGIDSSAVTAMMAQVSRKSISTFTVSFDETEYSEARYAEMVAKKYNTNHNEIVLRPEEMLHELPHSLQAMDHPGGDGPNTYIVSKATRKKGIKVVLTGLGGDELFAGYPVFKNALALKRKKVLAHAPSFIKKGISSLISLKGKTIANEKIREVLRLPGPVWPNFYSVSRSMFPSAYVDKLVLNKNVNNPVWEHASYVYRSSFHANSVISYISRCELNTYLQNVLLRDTDQMTMAHALEARAPFLDHRLVEYVLSLPDNEKIPVTPKALFVDAMGDLLPREIVDRPKMGFTFPWEKWMRHELKSFCEERLQNLSKRDLFNTKLLNELWEKFMKQDPSVNWARIWIFVVLEDWLERNGINS